MTRQPLLFPHNDPSNPAPEGGRVRRAVRGSARTAKARAQQAPGRGVAGPAAPLPQAAMIAAARAVAEANRASFQGNSAVLVGQRTAVQALAMDDPRPAPLSAIPGDQPGAAPLPPKPVQPHESPAAPAAPSAPAPVHSPAAPAETAAAPAHMGSVLHQARGFDARAAWQKLLGEMQLSLPAPTYYTWLHDTWVDAYEDGDFIIATANTFACDWLTNRLRRDIRKALKEIVGHMVDVRFIVRPRLIESASETLATPLYGAQHGEAVASAAATPPPVERSRRPAGESLLNPTYTFESFIVGNNNRFACAAAQAITTRPGHKFNPLFVYGGVGLGKTHLLHAIGNACRQEGFSVLYCTSEQFVNDLISAIRTQNTETFRNKYREMDVLLVDDIQFIAGKESTQEEFFHTFNHLQACGKQIVLSSDRPPRGIQSMEERLRSRFEGGIQVDISSPDFETRVAILQSKALRLGISVPLDVLKLVAERVDSNIRELEGALNHLFLQAQLMQSSMDMELAHLALERVSPQRKPCAPPRLIALAAAAARLSVDDLVGPRRTRPIADARHIAMYLLRSELALSLPQIGQLLGGRDHTTVAHAIGKIEAELQVNEVLRDEVAALRERVYSPAS